MVIRHPGSPKSIEWSLSMEVFIGSDARNPRFRFQDRSVSFPFDQEVGREKQAWRRCLSDQGNRLPGTSSKRMLCHEDFSVRDCCYPMGICKADGASPPLPQSATK
ncbi:hypothetical protein MAP00_008943 [Monascus purpureus]|nr:hypothetical protein MAP00_008943 [Monascus purpureus]